MISGERETAGDWRERGHDALDLMRDEPQAGRRAGLLLLQQAHGSGDRLAGLGAELVLVFAAYYEGRLEQADIEFERLTQRFEAVGDRLGLALCLFGTLLIWRSRGRTQEAYALGHERLLPLLPLEPTREAMLVQNAMGIVAQERGRTDEAIRHFYGALEAARALALPNRVAQIMANIGEVFYVSGNAEDAESMLTEAAQLARGSTERWLLPFVSTLLALSKLSLEKYGEAHDAIADHVENIGHDATANVSNRAFCLSVAAYTLAMRDQLDAADELCDTAMGLLGQFEDKQLKPYCWWVRGHLHHRRGRIAQAVECLTRAVEDIGDIGYVFMPLRAIQELAEIHAGNADWEAAYHAHQRYHALFAHAQDQATRVRLQTLHIKSELKEAENARRHAETLMAERHHLEQSLKQSLAEREAILENAIVGIVLLTPEGRVHWANSAMIHMFGVQDTAYVGKSLEAHYPSRGDYLKTGAAVGAAVGKGLSYETELRMVRRDGSTFWAFLSGRAVKRSDLSQGTVWTVLDITTRRRLEEDLNKSEEHYRQVVNNVTEGILVVQDEHIVFANPRVLQLTGYASDELVGQPFMIDVHPDDRAMVADRYARRMRGEKIDANYCFRVIEHLSGESIWVELSVVVIEWEGRPATLCFLTDLTQRRRLEESLKQSLAERETILENSIVGMVFLNRAGRVHWANSAMFQIFGVEQRTAPIGKSLVVYYPSRDAYRKTRDEVSAAVRQGLSYETELRMRRDDGSLFWAYMSGRAVNPQDLSQGTVWVMMDITKRRQLEEDLYKSEEHHRQVINNVTECILVVREGHIVFANQRLFQLTGYGQEEMFLLPFVTAIHPDDRALVIDHHTRRLRGEAVEQYYQFRLVNKLSGHIIWVELSAVMIEWEGSPATLSFMTDITTRRQLEESLKQSLEERMRLQTLQIQTELKEAESARHHAEETTRAKSMFLANMSHEIRTPMNAIIGMAHLALRTGLNPRQRDYVEKIHGAGISLLGVINDILDFSKIEAGKLDMEEIDFSLDDVLRNVATVTSEKAHEKGLEYLFQAPPTIPRNLVGDPLRLGQVLINLINNAIKFTEHGEIYVSCRRREQGDGRIQLEFEVRDTGIGMSPEQAAKLFRAFSQADESTTRKYGGTGLGLSISKGMVELMGGTIWLQTALGAGTAIHFTAWFGLAAAQVDWQVLPQQINGMRMLVVDDNPIARQILADSMSALPVEVDMAANGREALAAIRACDALRPYGVVFTDLYMAELDGIELICAVRNDRTLNAPPRIVLVSAHGHEEVRSRSESALPDGFLAKPISPSMLVDTLVDLFAPSGYAIPARVGLAAPQFDNLRVLLVEDNEINQQIAVELMEASGIMVDVARNGRVALEILSAAGPERYGMVFMDVQMPEMDGHEATRRVRANPRFAALPIAAMTAHAMVEERARCFASGMNDHLSKPINPADLYRVIGRWCPDSAPIAVQARSSPAPQPRNGESEFAIAGFDVQDGLERTLGDRAFYLRLLAMFRDDQREACARIREALAANDRPTAERLAHTLKGVSGQVGARAMPALAGELEQAIHRGDALDALAPLLAAVESELYALWQALEPVLADAARDGGGMAAGDDVDLEAAYALIQRLLRLLRKSDGEAFGLLAESSALLAAALGREAYQAIEHAARVLDFDGVLAALVAGAQAAGYEI